MSVSGRFGRIGCGEARGGVDTRGVSDWEPALDRRRRRPRGRGTRQRDRLRDGTRGRRGRRGRRRSRPILGLARRSRRRRVFQYARRRQWRGRCRVRHARRTRRRSPFRDARRRRLKRRRGGVAPASRLPAVTATPVEATPEAEAPAMPSVVATTAMLPSAAAKPAWMWPTAKAAAFSVAAPPSAAHAYLADGASRHVGGRKKLAELLREPCADGR